jgi:hypothetical protein
LNATNRQSLETGGWTGTPAANGAWSFLKTTGSWYFVPKAQTSQWELQLMPKTAVGNIVEADTPMRRSLDRAMLVAVWVLEAMGARMISTIEYSKAGC